MTATEPSAEEVRMRRAALGCAAAEEAFIGGCEFISLGCFCALTEALVYLGLRQRAYPFDWTRSSLDGIIHCFETGFEDFLTYTEKREAHNLTVFAGARWGGSFWHHDLDDVVVQQEFERRVLRVLGLADVPSCRPRIFVRFLNSTRELDQAVALLGVLKRCLPLAPIRLLLIVDMQQENSLLRVEGAAGEGLLIHFLNKETVYGSTKLETSIDYQARARGYAGAIASAIRYWAGGTTAVSLHPTLAHISASCEQWFGGDPSSELFSPQFFKGRRLAVSHTSPALQRLIHGKEAEFMLPEGTVPGSSFRCNLFGEDVILLLPAGASAGCKMNCRLVQGVLSVVMVSVVTAAPTAAAGLFALGPGGAHVHA